MAAETHIRAAQTSLSRTTWPFRLTYAQNQREAIHMTIQRRTVLGAAAATAVTASSAVAARRRSR